MRHKANRFLILTVILAIAQLLPAREKILINDNWNFRFSHQVNSRPQRVELPHSWNCGDALSGRADYMRGTGVYEKEVSIPQNWKGKRIFLRSEGANTIADVFVNSTFAGEHRGGYGAFVFELTDLLDFKKSNKLTIKVSNAPTLDVMPLVGDFNIYGGLYRDMYLIATEPTNISLTDYASSGVYLTQKSVTDENATIEAKIIADSRDNIPRQITAKVKIIDDRGNVVSSNDSNTEILPGRTEALTMTLSIDSPHLWNGREDPYLYKAVAAIYDESGQQLDYVVQPLGLRYFSVGPEKGFLLNGRPLRLYGVNRHQDRAERGNALYPSHHREDAEIIYEIGATAVRLAHYPQAELFYDLMDRLGIIVWAEIPFIGPGGYHDRGFNNIPAFKENGKEQLREMIRQHYNHPSICFWGLFNELKTHGDNPQQYIATLDSIAHTEDQSRLTTAASFLHYDNPINKITDLIAWNQYFGWYGGKPSDLGTWLDANHRSHPEYCIGLSEYGAGASIYHQQDSIGGVEASGWWHPENYQTFYHMESWKALSERPFVWGSFVWNLFDFGAAHRTEGDRPGINDKGLVTFDRKTKKDAFYFYKANWNKKEKFVYIANRRHERRTSHTTDIIIFSNEPEIELKVNGKSLGKVKGDGYATFVWHGVCLTPGKNLIEAFGKKSNDRAEWFLE